MGSHGGHWGIPIEDGTLIQSLCDSLQSIFIQQEHPGLEFSRFLYIHSSTITVLQKKITHFYLFIWHFLKKELEITDVFHAYPLTTEIYLEVILFTIYIITL